MVVRLVNVISGGVGECEERVVVHPDGLLAEQLEIVWLLGW